MTIFLTTKHKYMLLVSDNFFENKLPDIKRFKNLLYYHAVPNRRKYLALAIATV